MAWEESRSGDWSVFVLYNLFRFPKGGAKSCSTVLRSLSSHCHSPQLLDAVWSV